MRKVQTQTRRPNLFNVTLERDPSSGAFTVVGHKAQRLVMKNQYEGEWETVSPRDMARALRNSDIVSN